MKRYEYDHLNSYVSGNFSLSLQLLFVARVIGGWVTFFQCRTHGAQQRSKFEWQAQIRVNSNAKKFVRSRRFRASSPACRIWKSKTSTLISASGLARFFRPVSKWSGRWTE